MPQHGIRVTSRMARNQWDRRVCLVYDHRSEHPALPRFLVAATKPPVGRLVLLSKLEETLFIDGKRLTYLQTAIQALFTHKGSAISNSFASIHFPFLPTKSKESRSRSLSS